jgi:hypothetical protein
MKYKIILLSWFLCSGCTVIGISLGSISSYHKVSVETIDPGDDVWIIKKNGIEEEGQFVIYDTETIQIAVDRHPLFNGPDTLLFSMDEINHVEKRQWWPPWVGGGIGFVIDFVIVSAILSDVTLGVKF